MNHFCGQINQGHLRKAGGSSGGNVVLHLTTIKIRTIVRKIIHEVLNFCCWTGVVYWPSTRPNMPFPKWCTGRKWHIPMASNRKKSRWRIWLTKWDKVKAYDTLIDWCTGREWPLNCMTVISAWWRWTCHSKDWVGDWVGDWTII